MVSFISFHDSCVDCFKVVTTKERFHSDQVMSDPRITIDKSGLLYQAVLCFPIFSNQGQLHGVVYYANRNPFEPAVIAMQSLLCRQVSTNVTNALLFHSLQSRTQDHLKVIELQTEALEAARRGEEQALRATEVSTR